jgi:probable rRNA maturation factor
MPKRSPKAEPTAAVHVTTRGGPFGVDARTIRRRAERMLAALELHAELSVALVDDRAIEELNHTYRGNNRPTDVLAFAMREGEPVPRIAGEPELLGDVIISVPTAARQATQARRPLLDELTMLLAHGLLHLVGYDHQTDAEERVMTARTRELEAAATRRAS